MKNSLTMLCCIFAIMTSSLVFSNEQELESQLQYIQKEVENFTESAKDSKSEIRKIVINATIKKIHKTLRRELRRAEFRLAHLQSYLSNSDFLEISEIEKLKKEIAFLEIKINRLNEMISIVIIIKIRIAESQQTM